MLSRYRYILISVFVVVWLSVFYYESIRFFYLQPLVKRELPKLKFLYPPAGWIMFYHVGSSYGLAEVYGVKDGQTQLIDPHDILSTRPIGYDNINRNALVTILDKNKEASVCAYLRRKFNYFDRFIIAYTNYPDVVRLPWIKQQAIAYQCP